MQSEFGRASFAETGTTRSPFATPCAPSKSNGPTSAT